ncbi:uncharacterized protein YbbK (DUF523 family)/uncharacterized protein YbgA (DUF1722 family) [Clostridium tetanomorphum]|uniref:YbgA family protein n=1 Tax=Clostridium tetanomorphum TaxID=1553 RepID=UPI00044CF9EB|nr:DUF523 and DUF1722 domain-containing protein [Clostridium tetanomorphum]KAJ50949.1 hypothetical protein CTM_15038 [Clostridium tetanomorphum DSM 665]KAJ52535.1 hypothetical protein CTM_07126 [Clostridium tetanomorphum DSM 665]MBP1863455.1 uncharacterized protein YbbK (DUF523 family)/uncharacterized protein YbgA (DUF1722 family) [Clostridium tetanomorphum]NRS83552.1 uncharacterized protein YbbK (DUF523 family)/uncharacterized protein YbgA (DUF1722 family) [Clostridium tetanomorphum]SQC01929.
MSFEKPRICVSRCLGFEACRYNGQMSPQDFIEKLKDKVEIITVCPEVQIGLPIPRESLRIVKEKEELYLIQPKTEKDFTREMVEFSKEFIENLENIDGFILKSRSPSCGIKDVKVYIGRGKSSASEKGRGFFAEKVINKFPNYPIEDEGRLTNYKIRERFLTRIYINAAFREIKYGNSMGELVEFHSKNKMLLMAYNQKIQKELGKIVANHEKHKIEQVLNDYERYLKIAFIKNARYTSNINVLNKAVSLFSKYITLEEKEFIRDTIEKYREDKVPFSTCLYIIKSYAIRFGITEMLQQSFFQPYPEELVELKDSGKGRI